MERVLIRQLPVKTKSIYSLKEKSDGTRILVSRFYPRGVKRDHFELWIRGVSPEAKLLKSYKKNEVNWRKFSSDFRKQLRTLETSKEALEQIAQMSKKDTVTLLCYEKEGEKCHRHIVKSVIDRKNSPK